MQFPLAAIDLGTNTARLLISCVGGSRIRPVIYLRKITRLGGGFTKERGISPEAAARTVAAMRDFAAEIERQSVARVRAVATSAVRDAINGQKFCDLIRRESGIELEVIDGETEARLTLKGALAENDGICANTLVFDVGGGSTEYTLAKGEEVLFTESLPLGVVRLTEGKGSTAAMEEKIRRELAAIRLKLTERGLLAELESSILVGTAGTATTLAAVSLKMTEYDYRLVNNHQLSLTEIKDILSTLLPMTPEERLNVPGLEKGREDLIIAGILITLNTMEILGFSRLKVSDFGLLEGVLLSMCHQH